MVRQKRLSVQQAFRQAWKAHQRILGREVSLSADEDELPQQQRRPKKRSSTDASGGHSITSSDGGGGGGGFIVEDEDDQEQGSSGGGGGFIVDDEEEKEDEDDVSLGAHTQPTHLALEEVPHALALLGLPTEDQGILSVFANAAEEDYSGAHTPAAGIASSSSSSLGDEGRRRGERAPRQMIVSREKFEQVCEVLLMDEGGAAELDQQEEDQESDARRRRRKRPIRPTASDEGGSSTPETTRRPRRAAAAAARRPMAMEVDSDDEDEEDVYRDDGESDGLDDADAALSDSDTATVKRKPKAGGRGRIRPSKTSESATSTPSKTGGTRRKRARPSTSDASASHTDASDEEEDEDEEGGGSVGRGGGTSLTGEQLEAVQDAWHLFTDKLDQIDAGWRQRQGGAGVGSGKQSAGGGEKGRLGLREIQRLAIVTGVKMSEKEMEEMLLFACQSFAPATSKYMTREGAKAQRLAAANAVTAKVGPGADDEGTEVKGYEGGVGLDEFAGVLKRGRMI